MSGYPEQVQRLHDALRQLPGVEAVELGIQGLDGITERDLSLPGEFGDLPQVALMRTAGGKPDEVLATATIRFYQSLAGWVALEFLTWWVRDMARGGTMVQMRPLALPPVAFVKQLGGTLKFAIEFFFVCPDHDTSPVLEALDRHAASLEESIETYADALAHPATAGLTVEHADIDVLREAAEGGHAEAQFMLAQRYREADGTRADPHAAFRWYQASAEQGYPPALMFVGVCYAHGIGVECDLAAAVEYYRRAANSGLPLAMGLLGDCYEKGTGIDPDAARAVQWYRQAAELGERGAQAQLGECYEFGRGVPRDHAEALRWYKLAKDQGLDAVDEAIARLVL